LKQSIVEATTVPSTAVVSRLLHVQATTVWEALTEKTTVCRGFGTLSGKLRQGSDAHLDFGDGDFFTLEVLQIEAPYLLQYAWRFLGIGPLDTITWHIVPQDIGCRVTVTDSEPGRSREAATELKKGWLDFTRRLSRFLATGKSTRYDWRREFEGSIELAGKMEDVYNTLFSPQMQARWLPLGVSVLETVFECWDPNVIHHARFTDHNLDSVKQVYGRVMNVLPDLQFEIQDVIAEGDRVVTRITARATHRGELMGKPPTGKPVECTLIDIARIDEGKIVEHWGLTDELHLMEQVGLVPTEYLAFMS
jgi:predicted ester cyclase/uncharacterized protein YndB with AHSA1/START domain